MAGCQLLLLMLLPYAYSAVATTQSPATTPSAEFPSMLLTNQGFFLNDTYREFHFAESFYPIEIPFNRTTYRKQGIGAIFPTVFHEWDLLTELGYQSAHDRIMEQCKKGYLSYSALGWQDLEDKLVNEVIPALEKQNMELTFPIMEDVMLNDYYYHNLTTCTAHPKGINITLKIPAKRKGLKFQFKRAIRVDFMVRPDQMCHLGEDPEAKFIIMRNGDKIIMTNAKEFDCDYERTGTGVIKDLCIIPQNMSSNVSPCLEAIISNGSIEEIHKNCRKYDCEKRDRGLSVAGNSLFVADFNPCIKLNCTTAAMTREEKCIETPKIGALEVSLCKCAYHLGLGLYLTNGPPCPPAESMDYRNFIRKVFPSSMIVDGRNVTVDFLQQQEQEQTQ